MRLARAVQVAVAVVPGHGHERRIGRRHLIQRLAQLRAAGIEIIQGPESHENGKFAWLMDPDGNKVELWEPKLWDEKNKSA